MMEKINYAHSLLAKGQPSEALQVLGPSPADWLDEKTSIGALAEFYRGLAHHDMGAGKQALICIRRALEILRPDQVNPGDPGVLDGLLSICSDAGRVEYRWGSRLRTVELSLIVVNAYREASESERSQTRSTYAMMTFDSGAIALDIFMPGVALSLLNEALRAFSSLGDAAGVVRACTALATCEESMGDRALALQYISRAEALGEEARDSEQMLSHGENEHC